jgi:hypothetical protein
MRGVKACYAGASRPVLAEQAGVARASAVARSRRQGQRRGGAGQRQGGAGQRRGRAVRCQGVASRSGPASHLILVLCRLASARPGEEAAQTGVEEVAAQAGVEEEPGVEEVATQAGADSR